MQLRDKALDAFGRIDILVNNATINVPSPFEDLAEEAWDRVMDTNLKGVFFCSQIIGKEMIEQRSGIIVNIASMAGHYSFPHGGLRTDEICGNRANQTMCYGMGQTQYSGQFH